MPRKCKGKQKGAKSPKPRCHALQIWFPYAFYVNLYLHEFFELILFFDPHGLYSPWFKREIWPNLNMSKILETEEATPTKIGFHAFHVNLY